MTKQVISTEYQLMVRTNAFVRALLLYWILSEIGFQTIGEQLANDGIFTFERSVLVGSGDRFLQDSAVT